MEIRDVLYGSVVIEDHERPVLDSRYFQRLRSIKQLGFAEFSYPSATHNRYVHSLGAMHVATQAFETIFAGPHHLPTQQTFDRLLLAQHNPSAFTKLRAVVRLAAMLHDIGHGPLSHTTEFAMPNVKELKVPRGAGEIETADRKATHEDYTLKFILDSGLTPILNQAGASFGFQAIHIAALIDPTLTIPDQFFTETVEGVKVNFRPILHQLISSELDADRMDYLQRDSFHAGVSYGQFDYDWLLGNLTSYVTKGKCYLSLQHRALYSFEDFLISRFHMFLMVYFHAKSVVYDEMLGEYFRTAPGEYSLPADIEKYLHSSDAQLYGTLARSKNEWAKRITHKEPFKMLIELHSGIPAGKTAKEQQEKVLNQLKKELAEKETYFLEGKSTGELSKYFRKPGDPIFVRYDNHYSEASFIPLEKCTDLFERYSEKRSLTRLYVSPEAFLRFKGAEKAGPLAYEPN